ncbi:MAG: 2-oxoacid:acceptor oxidoreductase subunit alpha [Bacteroidales bacterium]|nr:2-oxoacid:acceptor oxidoreductase subunit alpha [Bacteroidales bacterium]MCF8456148.1 2-oxoacid:acceptor oxidoreductase subunit alpha [Bacteroidales bacterium]
MAKEAKIIELDKVVIRFSGDSGDGMQLTGTLFSDTSALIGNDLATFPDYPAEIRAPQGTVGGVSGFQVHLGHSKVNTPGDYADVLVAMNPAALKASSKWTKRGGTIIVDIDSFTEKNLLKAGYKTQDPITEDKLGDFNIIEAPISLLTKECLKEFGLDAKSVLRSKNMFALGMVYWLFNRPMDHTLAFFEKKFKKIQVVVDANKAVLKAGYNYAETIEALTPSYLIKPAEIAKGTYRSINGNTAAAWGLIAAAEKANLPLFLGSYPITPATEILQELAARKDLGVKVFQAEDEIAGICTSIGASFAGSLAATSTSGPGLALKSEAIGLAVITELPLVVINVQRGGPSTGLPTKTEQSDLMQALYGRNGESPVCVIASSTPSNCFYYSFMAAKFALEHMTPVILLTDGFLANGSEPWKVPSMADMPEIKPRLANINNKEYQPYLRDDETLVREWAKPGIAGLEHRIGGLEKMNITGTVSYVPENHEVMSNIREEKIKRIENYIPLLETEGDESGEVLVVGWGGTYGHLISTVELMRAEGKSVSLAHFNYINPLPKNTAEVFSKFKKIVVCEINLGQFASYLRMKHQSFHYHQINKVQGLPFTVQELKEKIEKILEA